MDAVHSLLISFAWSFSSRFLQCFFRAFFPTNWLSSFFLSSTNRLLFFPSSIAMPRSFWHKFGNTAVRSTMNLILMLFHSGCMGCIKLMPMRMKRRTFDHVAKFVLPPPIHQHTCAIRTFDWVLAALQNCNHKNIKINLNGIFACRRCILRSLPLYAMPTPLQTYRMIIQIPPKTRQPTRTQKKLFANKKKRT